jgi:hypothetical protein
MVVGDRVWVTKYGDPNDTGVIIGPSTLGEGCWLVEFPVPRTEQVIRLPWHESELTLAETVIDITASNDKVREVFKKLSQTVSDVATRGGLRAPEHIPPKCPVCQNRLELSPTNIHQRGWYSYVCYPCALGGN